MKKLKVGLGSLFTLLVVAACAAPIGPVPGFLIGGSLANVPDTWGNTLPIHEFQLQVGNGPIGRTVLIWTVQMDGDLYVLGQKDSRWTQAIGPSGPVRLSMDGSLYELTATAVEGGSTKSAVTGAWLRKYEPHYPDLVAGFGTPAEGARKSTIFRLTRRS